MAIQQKTLIQINQWISDACLPEQILTVSEWADKYRILSQKASAEPGVWRTDRVPYLREIMDALSVSSPVEEVVMMKGAQTGGTEAGNNWVGYVIDHAPGPMMMVMPTADTAKKNSRIRIQPLIDECPRLSDKVSDAKSRDGSNTVLQKDFPGGTLVIVGANSGPGLRSLPMRYLFLDELDGYPLDVDGEGDPVALVEARARTFARKKKFKVSTPTVAGRSRIEAAFDETDKRYYYVPCPRCGEMEHLKWQQIKWNTEKPLGAWYECEHCNGKIENWEKTKMLAAGEWRPTRKQKNPKVIGFHLNSLYSPVGWLSWGECAEEWEKTKASKERLKGFINTVLGETWKERGDAPDWKRLYERRESYKIGSVPPKVLFLTAGVDIQKDRIEVEVVGWGRDKLSWSVDYRVFMGDTSTLDSPAWEQLTELLYSAYTTVRGLDIPIRMMAVDSGYNTKVVYSWVRQFPITHVIAVKGQEHLQFSLGRANAVDVNLRNKVFRRGLKLFPVGVSVIKKELYGWLNLDTPDEGKAYPYGFCFFPEYEEEHFKQLTAEQLVEKVVRGHKKYEWEKTRDRNEALDCRVYSIAAASACGMDRYKDHNWARLESDMGVANSREVEKPEEKKQSPSTQKSGKKVTIKRRKSKFL